MRRGGHKAGYRLFAGLMVTLLFACICGCGTKSPGDVVKEFETLVAQDKYEAASRHVSSDSRQMYSMMAAMGQGLTAAFGSPDFKSVEITGERISGNRAEVSYVFHFGDGSTGWERQHDLVKEGGRWRINIQY